MPYIGNPAVVGDSTNTFKLLDDIQSFTVTFDATDTAVVSISGDTLTFNNHRFLTGQRVTYTDGGGTAIGGLTDGTVYFIIKVDQNTIQLATNASNAAAGTAIDLTSGAAGGSHTLNVAFDGVNTKFSATHSSGTKASISRAAQISLSINGVIQQPQDTGSPTTGYGVLPGSIIIFSTPPASVDKVFGTFIGETAPSFDITDNTVDNFTGDGSTTSFNLSRDVPSSNDVLVTLDGVTQYPTDSSATRSYAVIESTLTFVSAPATGVAIQVRHIGFAGATTSAVTGFYGRQGNAALTSTDDISVQNISGVGATFTSNVNIEGVLTYEDVTNVDSIGIITARAGVLVGSGITLSKDGDGFFTGIVTATSYYGDGSNLSNITSTTINNNADNRLITGSGTANTLNGESTLTYDGTNLDLGDDKKIRLGASQDLQIFHDAGAGSNIRCTGTKLEIRSDSLILQASNAEKYLVGTANGAVELYYDNAKRLDTISTGIRIHGDEGGTAQLHFLADEGDDNADYWRIIGESSGPILNFQSYNSGNWTNNLRLTGDQGCELYWNNGVKVATSNVGVTVTGRVTTDDLTVENSSGNLSAMFTATNGLGTLEIGGSTGAFIDLKTPASDDFDLRINADGSLTSVGSITLAVNTNENGLRVLANGAVELYYDNTKMFETLSFGCKVSYGELFFPASSNSWGGNTTDPKFAHHVNTLYIVGGTEGIIFRENDTDRWQIDGSGHFHPKANNTYDIGTTSNRVRNVYTNDLHLSNEGSTNEVDGTWGDYTIQEGESDLFLINNRSGKKYKFNLTEVS